MTRGDQGRRRAGARSFWNDRSGNFAVLTAIAALPVMFTIGGAVDMNMYYANRTKIQNATDAAALAAARRFPFEPNESRLEGLAKDYFDANTGELFRTQAQLVYEGTQINENGVRELTLSANFNYSPLFLHLLAGQFPGMGGEFSHVESVIAIGNTTVEMAMVLDTSGSMSSTPAGGGATKIATLRRVASQAIDQLFTASEMANIEDPVSVSVVPFAGSVNLGVPLDTWWLDPTGIHPNHHDQLDWEKYNYTTIPVQYGERDPLWSDQKYQANQIAIRDPRSSLPMQDRPWVLKDDPNTYLTRQYLLRNMGNTSVNWNTNSCPRGYGYPASTTCSWRQSSGQWILTTVSGRNTNTQACQQNTDSTCHPPYTLNRTSQYFTQSTGNNPRVCAEVRSGRYSLTATPPNRNDPESLFLPYFAPDEYDNSLSFGNNYLYDRNSSYWTHPLGGQPWRQATANATNIGLMQRDVRKYLMGPNRVSTSLGTNNARSPYYICESDPIVPLSAQPANARNAVSTLNATGATNVEEGLNWGWRTLTPDEPFPGGRGRGDENNYKAVVLMTDGANTYYPNSSTNNITGYGAYGFSGDGRIFENTTYNPNASASHTSANLTRAMNQRTAQLCENVKNDGRVPVTTARGDPITDSSGGAVTRDGILIYTIAFDVNDSEVHQLMRNCASAHISDQRQGLSAAQSRKYFYNASSNAELEAAFDDIIASLSSLRIAR